MREHRKGVAVRVASVECGAHALTVIRGLGPRGGTSPLLSNRETRPGALEDEIATTRTTILTVRLVDEIQRQRRS